MSEHIPTTDEQQAPVESSQIASIGHDPATNTLAVRFHSSGDLYHYAGFSEKDFEAFKAAESVGKHFGSHVRNKFKHTRIAEPFTKKH